MNITKRVINFIENNNLSIEEISKATGISKDRLHVENTVYNAAEFLELCKYFDEDPWYFFCEDKNKQRKKG